MRVSVVLLCLLMAAPAWAAPPSGSASKWAKTKPVASSVARQRHLERYLSLRQLGDQLYNARRYDDALEVWSKLRTHYGDDGALLERLAVGQLRSGDLSSAADTYVRLLDRLGPPHLGSKRNSPDLFSGEKLNKSERYHRNLARLAHTWSLLGDHGRSLDAAVICAERLADKIGGQMQLADAYMHAGLIDEAEQIYLAVLALQPDNGSALNNLSTIRYLDRDLEGTMALLDAVLERARGERLEAIALSNVAEVLMLRGDYANSEAHYRAAMEAFPEGGFPHFGYAALLTVQGRLEAGIDAAITGWDLDRSGQDRHHEFFVDEAWQWQRDALVAEAEGRHEDALRLWEQVVWGSVKPLVRPARRHVKRLERLLGAGLSQP